MLLTVNELAEILKLNIQTIYRKVKKGEMPCTKIGSTIRFDKDVINKWLLTQSMTSLKKGAMNGKSV